jgi:trehalose utilization protein
MSTVEPLRVTIWNEYLHEVEVPAVRAIYPHGIHETLKLALSERLPGCEVTTATLRQERHGLSKALLAATDVLVWWGHKAHAEVCDAWAEKVHQAVLSGMGLVVLHSGHFSKPFKRVLGTNCSLVARGRREGATVEHPALPPDHGGRARALRAGAGGDVRRAFRRPRARRVADAVVVPGRRGVPQPLHLARGHGRVVYFRPGHETYPTYHHRTCAASSRTPAAGRAAA